LRFKPSWPGASGPCVGPDTDASNLTLVQRVLLAGSMPVVTLSFKTVPVVLTGNGAS